MEEYQIICSHCGESFFVSDAFIVDANVKCPFCHQQINKDYQVNYRPALKNPATKKISAGILIALAVIILLGLLALLFI